METKGGFPFEIIIDVLFSFSAPFQYLCYGSTAIRPINSFTLTARGSTIYRRQNLTSDSRVDPRAVRLTPWTHMTPQSLNFHPWTLPECPPADGFSRKISMK